MVGPGSLGTDDSKPSCQCLIGQSSEVSAVLTTRRAVCLCASDLAARVALVRRKFSASRMRSCIRCLAISEPIDPYIVASFASALVSVGDGTPA